MIQITPQMWILVTIELADFRAGIDGLARLCKDKLRADAFSGSVFVFRNRQAAAIQILIYHGQGFWLCHKRLFCLSPPDEAATQYRPARRRQNQSSRSRPPAKKTRKRRSSASPPSPIEADASPTSW